MFNGFPTEKQTFAFCRLLRIPRPWMLARRYKMRLDYCSLPLQTRLGLIWSVCTHTVLLHVWRRSFSTYLPPCTARAVQHQSSQKLFPFTFGFGLGFQRRIHREGHVLNHMDIFVLRYHSVGWLWGRRGCRVWPHILRCAGRLDGNNKYYLMLSIQHLFTTD